MACFESLWLVLGRYGSFCAVMASFGSFWLVLSRYGSSWVVMAPFASSWLVLDRFARFGSQWVESVVRFKKDLKSHLLS